MILLFVGGFAVGQQHLSYKNFLGTWKAKDGSGKQGTITFIDSMRIRMSVMGGDPHQLYYRLDFSAVPAKLDLYRDQAREDDVFKSLVQLLDPKSLKWQIFPNGRRSDRFDEESAGNILVLKKEN